MSWLAAGVGEGAASLFRRTIEAAVANDGTFAKPTTSELPLVDDDCHEQCSKGGTQDNTNCNAGFSSRGEATFLGLQIVLEAVELTCNDHADRSSFA